MRKLILALALLLYACASPQSVIPLASPASFTIQAAVNAAQVGDVVTVPAGTYTERVTISKSVTVKCEIPMMCTVVGGFNLHGSNIVLDGFVIRDGITSGIEVTQHNNIVRNIEIFNIITSTGPGGDADGIRLFGTGHQFDQINIHDINSSAPNADPHTDCFQTWNWASKGGAASYITITNAICNQPFPGKKMFQSEGGSHDWVIRNVISISGMMCIFKDEAYNIDISYATFIGAGSDRTGGCKFLKLTDAPAPHDNKITYSIFQNITTSAIEETGDAVQSSNNCYWQTRSRTPEPGDVYADPLLLADYSVPANSPCAGMGWKPASNPVTPTITVSPTATPTTFTQIPTLTPTQTLTPPAPPLPSTPRILMPLYNSPSVWGQVVSANAHGNIDVIVNPHNGVGASRSTAHVSGIALLRGSGSKIYGYVETDYGSRSMSSVKAEVDTWLSWYAPDGIFLDEVDNTNDAVKLAYYGNLSAYIRALGLGVIANPGTMTVETYAQMMDTNCIYESTPPASLPFPSWGGGYPSSEFCGLVFGASIEQMRALITDGRYGYLYITSDILPNPWDAIPPYLAEEAALLAGMPVPATATPTPSLTPTITRTPTATATFTSTLTPTKTVTPSPSPTRTPTMICIEIDPTITVNGVDRGTICFAK